jgi:hypothetical protein
VAANAEAIAATLGAGRHFGEWWGAGVQRRYGQTAKRFSLFNVSKYGEVTEYLDRRCTWGGGDSPNDPVTHQLDRAGVKRCACRDARPEVRVEIGGVLVDSVPLLYRGPWHTVSGLMWAPDWALDKLRREGSVAAPGFMDPEGIVTFHEASGQLFKATIKGDEKPKGENR